MSHELTLDEKSEAIDKSLNIVEILAYFITETAQTENTENLDSDSRQIYFSTMREVLMEFLSVNYSYIPEIEDHRTKSEKILSKIKENFAGFDELVKELEN